MDQRKELVSLLEERYPVMAAGSLKDAKQQLLENGEELALALIDVRLDENNPANRDGFNFLKELRRQQPHVPAVIMTAYGDAYIQAQAQTLGAKEFLSKPLNLDELDAVLDRTMGEMSAPAPLIRRAWSIVCEWMPPIVFFVLFVLSWEGICHIFQVKEYLVPPPSKIVAEIVKNAGLLAKDTGVTMLEAILGFFMANIASILFAVGFAHFRWFERSLYPYTIGLKSIPIIAIAPLLVLWCGNGLIGKVIMAAIISFFPLVVNATIGLKSVNPEALDLMRSLSASSFQILFKLRFPTAMPYIFSALKISAPLAVVGAIVGELSGATKGIGYTILIASYRVQTTKLFAAIFLASVGGLLFFALIAIIEKFVISWEHGTFYEA